MKNTTPSKTFTEAERRRQFELYQRAADPQSWFTQARRLLEASELVEPALRQRWEDINANPFGDRDIGFASVHLMLVGYAIENFCKGCIVAINEKARQQVSRGNLPSLLKSHDVLRLAEEAGLGLSGCEKELLGRVGRAIEWIGRYPVPLRSDQIYIMMNNSRDIDDLRAFIQRLKEYGVSLLEKEKGAFVSESALHI